jgi:DNA-binding GntR family transcriptional regulator
MAQNTTRDQLWTYALKRTWRTGEPITSEELATMAQSSERSARDVLKTMAQNGFLDREQLGRSVRYVASDVIGDEE